MSYGESDAQDRGGPKISFGNHCHKMIPGFWGVHDIVWGKQVEWGVLPMCL